MRRSTGGRRSHRDYHRRRALDSFSASLPRAVREKELSSLVRKKIFAATQRLTESSSCLLLSLATRRAGEEGSGRIERVTLNRSGILSTGAQTRLTERKRFRRSRFCSRGEIARARARDNGLLLLPRDRVLFFFASWRRSRGESPRPVTEFPDSRTRPISEWMRGRKRSGFYSVVFRAGSGQKKML